MTLKDTLEAAAAVIGKKAKENPDMKLKKGNIQFTYQELSQELKNVASWCYKGEVDTVRVTRCKYCKNYVIHKQSKNPKDKGQKVCRLDNVQKLPEHYCAYGEQENNNE